MYKINKSFSRVQRAVLQKSPLVLPAQGPPEASNLMVVIFFGLSLFLLFSSLEAVDNPESRILPGGRVKGEYKLMIPARGGVPPYTWTVVKGTLPQGVVLSSGGELSGVFEKAGEYRFTVQVVDSQGEKTDRVLHLRVEPPLKGIGTLKIKTDVLPGAMTGCLYGVVLAVEGGVPPYLWQVKGTLPAGMELNSKTGRILGTPSEEGEATFNVTVKDSRGKAAANQTLKLAVVTVGAPKKWYEKWWVIALAVLCVIIILVIIVALIADKKCPRCRKYKLKYISLDVKQCQSCLRTFKNITVEQ